MKKFLIILVALVGVGTAFALIPRDSCDASDSTCSASQQASSKTLKADTVLAEVADGKALLIDVREPDEFQAGHAPESELVPVGDILAGKFKESDKDKKIYLYCRSGNRAGQALTALKSQGYKNVVNLGGLSDWQGMGGKTIK